MKAFKWVEVKRDSALELVHVPTGKVAAMIAGSFTVVFAPFTTNGKRSQYLEGGTLAQVEAVAAKAVTS